MEPRNRRSRFARTRDVSFILLVLLAAITPVLPQSYLKSRQDFVVGEHPVAAIVVDFDGDGNLDMITANQLGPSGGDVSLIKGFGDGTFRKVGSVVAGSLPSGLAFADVTSDGKPDLIVSNFQSQEVTVHPGNGLGAFGAAIHTLVSGRANGIAVGDWNGDNRLDIATVNDANVSSMLGDGAGHFGTLRQFAVGTSPKQIISANFAIEANGTSDGILDLAVVNNGSNNIQIFRGDGTGQFTLSRTLTTGTGPLAIAVGQFNADTRLDVAVANFGVDNMGVFLANTTGSFGSQTTRATGLGPRSLTATDLNADGKVDLIVGESRVSNVGEVMVFTGDGAGGFTQQPLVHASPRPNVVLTGDFNKDGKVDVGALSLTGDTISVLENAGTPLFVEAAKVTLSSGAFPYGVGVTDLNRDGTLDLVATNQGQDRLSVTLGSGSCNFGAVSSSTTTGGTPNSLILADFNGDTCADVVTANSFDDTMSYLQSNCTGGFSVNTLLTAGCVGPDSLASGDINADLNKDIAVVCQTSSQLCTRRGTGTGAFGASVCTNLVTAPGGVAVGLFDLDQFEDAAVTSTSLDVVATCISNGQGGCSELPPSTFPAGPGAQGVAKRDLNGDGYPDLVTANSLSNTITAMIGDGGGIFYYPPIESVAGLGPTAVALDDFNLDGKIDAAVVNSSANNISLMLGDGYGHFTKVGDYGTRALPTGIATGDCNADGKPDIMVADNFDDTITILLNQSMTGDGLQMVSVENISGTILRWGIVPGATFDTIRGLVRSVTQTPTTYNLGPVTCMGNDRPETDTASFPDMSNPPVGDAYFYLVRPTVGGTPGSYTVSVPLGKVGVPASGGCP